MDRRIFLISAFALAACSDPYREARATADLTDAYDGNHLIEIARLWTPTSSNLRDPNYSTEPETLALLTTTVRGGVFAVARVENNSSAQAYHDFEAAFLEGGVFAISSAVGFMLGPGKRDRYRLKAVATLPARLEPGQSFGFEPDNGFDALYRPYLRIIAQS